MPAKHTFLRLKVWAIDRQNTLSIRDSLANPLGYSICAPWHASCDSVNAGGRGAVSQRLYVCVREMTAYDHRTNSRHREADEPAPLAGGNCRPDFGLGHVTNRESGR